MNYLLGSDTERLRFTDHGVDVEPVGLTHAVDPDFPGMSRAESQHGPSIRR